MKTCIKHYHALIPQIDLIATQWGVDIEDTLSLDDLGLLKSEDQRQKRQSDLDRQLRNQDRETRRQVAREDLTDPVAGLPPEAGPPPGKTQQKGKTSAMNLVENLERLTNCNKDEVRKRREAESLLHQAEKDLRLLRRQLESQLTLPGRQINHTWEPIPVQSGLTESRQGLEIPTSRFPSSEVTTTASDVGIQLLQVLRDATASSMLVGRNNTLFEEYLDGHTERTFYHLLTTPWEVLPPDQGMIKKYYKVKDSNRDQFVVDRMIILSGEGDSSLRCILSGCLSPTKLWLCPQLLIKR
jgi:hypothetical protein